MSNQEEKKCRHDQGAYYSFPQPYSIKYWKKYEHQINVLSETLYEHCPLCPKPSPSKSCEHGCRESWTNFKVAVFNGRFMWEFYPKKDYPVCPICKPTAVEPSVESIAFALVHKFSIYTEDGTFFADNEPNEPKKLELLIAEALRNERNRHG